MVSDGAYNGFSTSKMRTRAHSVTPKKSARLGRRGTLFFSVLLVLSGVLFCALALAKKKPPTDAEVENKLRLAPAEAASWRNPYEGQSDAVAAGRKLFKRHCSECHASGSLEESHAADLRSRTIQGAAPGILFWLLKNGNRKDGMPSWSGLPEEQRWQIITYLKSLGPTPRTAGDAASEPDARR